MPKFLAVFQRTQQFVAKKVINAENKEEACNIAKNECDSQLPWRPTGTSSRPGVCDVLPFDGNNAPTVNLEATTEVVALAWWDCDEEVPYTYLVKVPRGMKDEDIIRTAIKNLEEQDEELVAGYIRRFSAVYHIEPIEAVDVNITEKEN